MRPDSPFRSGWNLMMAVLILYCAVVVPLEVAFESQMRREMGGGWLVWMGWNLLVDFTFIADIVLSFRTGFEAQGLYIDDPMKVAAHYLRGTFVIDLAGSFPLNLIMMANDNGEGGGQAAARLNRQLRLLRIIKLNRLLRILKLSKNLKYLERHVRFNPSVIRIVSLCCVMLGFCHWLGCAWWFIADLELTDACARLIATVDGTDGTDGANEAAGNSSSTIAIMLECMSTPQNAWQPEGHLLASGSFGLQFAGAFYWGAGMVTAIVPYDILPATPAEYWVTAVCMVVGLMLNAIVIGSMASALSSLDSRKSIAASKIQSITAYLVMNHVPAELKAGILDYYEYLFTSSQSMDELHLYQNLPPSLATRLALTMNRRLISRSPFLFGLSDDMLMCVLSRLKPCIFVPSQVVYAEGVLLCHMYFVNKGCVRLLRNMGKHELEREVRAVLQHESFGVVPTTICNEGDPDWRMTELASSTQLSLEGARAETYCDVMTLAMVDLHSLSSQNNLWARPFVTKPGPGAAAGRKACRVQGTGSVSIASIAGLRRKAAKLKAHHRASPRVKPGVADDTASRSGLSSPNSSVNGAGTQACSLRTGSALSAASHPVLSTTGTQLAEP